ncbi:MAG: hypothetical protein CEE40_08555 [Chloroflexi bacterium B3_Chlor]|nr:MAG: hypothetical protein CEE40_08555 [Chloroflexi bacterium B3_Chlor]
MRDVDEAVHDDKQPATYVPETFFYVTIALSLCFMILLAAQAVAGASIPRTSLMDALTFTMDTLAVQVCFAAAVSFATALLIYNHWTALHERLRGGATRVGSAVARLITVRAIRIAASVLVGISLVGLLMLAEFELEHRFFKPSFLAPRPAVPLPDPPFTRWLEGLLGVNASDSNDGDGAPSGYVLRQWYLLLLLVVVTEQLLRRRHDDRSRLWIRAIAYGLSFLTLLYVAFSRVYRLHHTMFDVGIAIGLGTLTFWLVALLPGAILHRNKKLITELGGSAFAYLFLFFFYSQSSYRWVVGALVIFLVLAIVYLLADRGRSYRGLYRQARKAARRE